MQATDKGGLNAATPLTYVFEIVDSNEAPEIEDQTFGGPGSAITINENAVGINTIVNGTVIVPAGDIVASDEDDGHLETLKWFILNEKQSWDAASDNLDRFEMDQATGAIYAGEHASLLDYETQDTYEIQVQVVDEGFMFGFATITLILSDVNESPQFSSSRPRLEIGGLTDNDSIDILIPGELTASDPDAADVKGLTFSIPDDPDFPFRLENVANDGDTQNSARFYLKAGEKIDHETTESYKVEVTVSDTNSPVPNTNVSPMEGFSEEELKQVSIVRAID